MPLSCWIGAFISFFKKHAFQTKDSIWVFKRTNSCFAVNALIGFLNYRIYTAHERETVVPKFSAEKFVLKNFTDGRVYF